MKVLCPAKIRLSSVLLSLGKCGYDFNTPSQNERENVVNVLVLKLIVILPSYGREKAVST